MMDRQTADDIKRWAASPDRHPLRRGIITDSNGANGTVKVTIMPDDTSTDFIPYVGMGIALGKWRGLVMPANGTDVLVVSLDPFGKEWVALGGFFNDEDPPPEGEGGYEPQSVLWEHEDGNKLLLSDDGTIYLGGKDGAHQLVYKEFLTELYNDLVGKHNALKDAFLSHVHIGNLGAPTTAPTPPPVLTSALSWSSGLITTKVKGI